MKISESEFEHCIPADGETVTNYLQKDTGTNQSVDVLSLFLGLSEATEIDKKGEPNILKILVYEGILGVIWNHQIDWVAYRTFERNLSFESSLSNIEF